MQGTDPIHAFLKNKKRDQQSYVLFALTYSDIKKVFSVAVKFDSITSTPFFGRQKWNLQ